MTTNNAANIGALTGTRVITQVAHGFAVNNVLYSTASSFALAKADAASTSKSLGIIIKVIDVDNFIIQFDGYAQGLSALTTDTIYYLSDSSAGALTATAPTAFASFIKAILITDSTTSGYLQMTGNPSTNIANLTPLNSNLLYNPSYSVAQRGTSFTSVTRTPNSDATILLDTERLLSDGNNITNVALTTAIMQPWAASAKLCTVQTANKQFGFVRMAEASGANYRGFQSLPLTAFFAVSVAAGNATLTSIRFAIIEWTSTVNQFTKDCISAWPASGALPTLVANYAYVTSSAVLTPSVGTKLYKISGTTSASATNVGTLWWTDNTNATANDTVQETGMWLFPGTPSSLPDTGTQQATGHQNLIKPVNYALDLAVCQRYAQVTASDSASITNGQCVSTTVADGIYSLPVQMRATPAFETVTAANYAVTNNAGSTVSTTALAIQAGSTVSLRIRGTVAAGLATGNATRIFGNTESLILSADLGV